MVDDICTGILRKIKYYERKATLDRYIMIMEEARKNPVSIDELAEKLFGKIE